MKTRAAIVLIFGSLLLAACSGESGGVGSPCVETEECSAGLECDVHDGAGTCQEPHEH